MRREISALFCSLLWITSLPAAAPHPTVLTVKYKDAMLPVVKVIGTDPVVMVDGKEKRIRTEPIYLPRRDLDFSRESVELKNVSLGGVQIRYVYDEADAGNTAPMVGKHGGLAEFKATVQAREAVEGAFIAVVLYTPAIFVDDSDYYQTQIVVHDLPRLPAGTEVPVRITSKMFTYLPGQEYFVQLFDRTGKEIATPCAQPGWKYYAMVERIQLAAVIKRYLSSHAGQDAPAKPVVIIKPLLPKNVPLPATPITAYLTVSPDGVVEEVVLSEFPAREVDIAVRTALGGWLFLPRLKAGSTVSSRVEVPLQF